VPKELQVLKVVQVHKDQQVLKVM